MTTKKIYFHELPQSEIDKIVEENPTAEELINRYKQPDWCTYPNALGLFAGCWSLCDYHPNGLRTKISKKYCNDCVMYLGNQGDEKKKSLKIKHRSTAI